MSIETKIIQCPFPCNITNGAVTVFINGQSLTRLSGEQKYDEIIEAIKNEEDPDSIADLFSPAKAVVRYSNGKVQVTDGQVLYNGEEVHNYIAEKILSFSENDYPFEALALFLERLLKNPSKRAIDELYPFLENGFMPITPDGCFLAYKGVKNDYFDEYSGKFDNSIGEILEMTRSSVDDDARNDCSSGFHAGSLDYANGWGYRTMVVKIDPADVVSVPYSDARKLRTCKYEVLSEIPRETRRDSGLDDHYIDETSDYYTSDDIVYEGDSDGDSDSNFDSDGDIDCCDNDCGCHEID